ncbi:MAG: hypothetical protein KKC51_07300, partial [Verrucomicrobia bacterium]|nr:hypothetical protein [Verrucomicrobiota bacterium]
LDTCTLSGNEAFDVGGGAYGGTLVDCRLEGNSAGYAGGGAAYVGLLTSCTLSNNVAGDYGGGAHQSTLESCLLVNNVSSNYGGGASKSTLTGCRVAGNDGGWGGGTYYGTIYSSTNDGNTAQIGGGAFESAMYSCLLTNNQAETGGGAYGGSLRNCVLAGNQATSGAGAYDSTLRWCRLTDNVADGRGGGAYAGTLYNCLLTGNVAGTGGATRAATLYNCTLAANTAVSGAGASYGTLVNCIAYNNFIGENLTNVTAQFTCSTPLPAGTNNIVGPPDFVGGGDYHLVYGSPCIDTGTNLSPSVTNDLDHVPRPLDGDYGGTAEYDMGCYEFGSDTNTPIVDITDPAADLVVPGTTTWYNFVGIYNTAVELPLMMVYSNAEGSATFGLYMASPWYQGLGLAYGTNYFTVIGTNSSGAAATDVVWIVRNGYGTPFVDITNVDEDVGFPVTTLTIGGTINDQVVGQVQWTNALTGDAGTFTAVTPWSIADIPLDPGINTITVRGTNGLGTTAGDSVEITRVMVDPGNSPIHYVALEGGHLWPFTNWFTAATNIQDAVNTADEGDMVLVTNGIYYLPQTVEIERGMTVQGLNGWSNTVVDGQQTGSCFSLEVSNIVVDGFTITNGYSEYGGGIMAWSPAAVQNCLITGNRADEVGGGMAVVAPLTIAHCQIIGNEVMDYLGQGGGVAAYGEILMEDCVVQGNTATNGSGGGS